MKGVQGTIFEARDGKKFVDILECAEYEDSLLITYHFIVYCDPDLERLNLFQSTKIIAVTNCLTLTEAKLNIENYMYTVYGASAVKLENVGVVRSWVITHVTLDELKHNLPRLRKEPGFEEIEFKAYKGI